MPSARHLLGLVILVSTATHAQSTILPPAAQQIAAAITPLPEELRAGAEVLGYMSTGGRLVPLRAGKNDMICLAPDPAAKDFHSACYHRGMEPFMARGRELRAEGVKGGEVDSVRFREVASGKIKMPAQPSMLYQIFGGTFNPANGTVTGGSWLYVTYMPFATAASTGLSAKPAKSGPWIMYPGTPKAHIMFSVGM
jgi:hypothetical protein